jgi:hypothetical protein
MKTNLAAMKVPGHIVVSDVVSMNAPSMKWENLGRTAKAGFV